MLKFGSRRLLFGIGLAALAVILGVGWQQLTSRSQAILDARHPLAPSAVRAATSPEAIAEGGRLAALTSCSGCHGNDLTGGPLNVFADQVVTPNLTLRVARMSDAELDRAIRAGLRPDGTSELVMPSQAYARLTDQEMADIIGYLRSLPAHGVDAPRHQYGPVLRFSLLTGSLWTSAEQVAAARPPLAAGPQFEQGRHLAAIACGRCHGPDLGGVRGAGPDMTVRSYYTPEQFHALIKKGDAIGEGDMQMMIQTAETSFGHFTDQEVSAIYAYLDARDGLLGAKSARNNSH